MTKPIKIGFMPLYNPFSRNTFSGTLSFMLRALQRRDDLEVTVLGGFKHPLPSVLGRIWHRDNDPFLFIPEEYNDMDAVIAPIAVELLEKWGDQIRPPVISVTDATPAYLRENYPLYPIPDQAERLEEAMFNASERIVYSSQFMADRAHDEFTCLQDRALDVVPFGVNVDEMPAAPATKPPLKPLRLLFIGKEWERKGGDIALAALDVLIARGIDVHMSVIGAVEPAAQAHSHVSVLGYLDKTRSKDAKMFDAALRDAHLLILPTRADCTPMVVAEANSFACPVAITDVGGVGSLVKNGENGQMLDFDASAEDWADAIVAMTLEHPDYTQFSRASYDYATQHLSWDAWAEQMVAIARDVVGP